MPSLWSGSERRVAITSVVRYSMPTEISGCLRILDLERGRSRS